MQWISISELISNIKKVLFRFPLKVMIVLFATAAAVYMVNNKEDVFLNTDLAKFLCFCNMTFTLSLATDLYSDSKNRSNAKKWLLKLLAVAVSAIIMLSVKPELKESHVFIIALFIGAFHMAVSFAAFLKKGFNREFWYFNKTIFLRILMCALYTGVIILGLCLAILAVDKLFNAGIDEDVYINVALIVLIAFNTILFLSGVPDVKNEEYGEQSYPKGLKIFTQYVLIPLMTIYVTILLLYEVKILIEWELPNGFVSMLIIPYAVLGILSLLLIHPIRNTEGNRWIQLFSKLFYILMIPLLVLLILAIYKRVSDYGITEERYALMALAVWLAGIAAYFLFSKNDNIKIIPISLALLALLCAAGPQSAVAVSKRSQQNRLAKHYPAKTDADKREVLSIVRYLSNNHGLRSLQPFTDKNLANIEKGILQKQGKNNHMLSIQLTDTVFAILNVDENADIYSYTTFYNTNKNGTVLVDGYSYVIPLEIYPKEQTVNIDSITIVVNKNQNAYTVKIDNSSDIIFSLDTLMHSVVEKYKKSNSREVIVSNDELSIEKDNEWGNTKMIVSRFSKSFQTDDKIDTYTLYLLLRPKQ